MKKIKWLFFDIGSTLVDESNAYRRRIERTVLNSDITINEFYSMYKKNMKDDNEIAKHFNLVLASWSYEDEILYPNVEFCLQELSEKYKIGVIANQDFGIEQRLARLGIKKYISLIISSAEEGIEKPNLQLFQLALKRAKCKSYEAIMIGDRLDNDIFPANKIGMKTIRVKQGYWSKFGPNSDKEKPDYEINEIIELLRLLL